METIAERLTNLINTLGIRKTQFAQDLGITQSSVSTMCSGKSNPSSQTLAAICRIYHVNEKWLRSGEGEMFLPRTKGTEMGDIVGQAMTRDAEAERQKMMDMISRLTDGEIVLLAQLLETFGKK